jgi:starch-binding outer membrane protein, SusD/RagB family
MKNSKIYFWVIFAIALTYIPLSGCKKFLDRKPLSTTATDIAGVEGEAMAMYNVFNTYAGYNHLPWIDFNSIRDDDAQKGSSASDGAEIVTEFETFQYTKDDWATNTYWNDHYYMINKANKLIHDAQVLGLTDAGTLRNIAEAHFFRAHSYYALVKTYGSIPLIDFYYESASDGIRPKSTVDDIYKLIDRDLDSAANFLPINWAGSSSDGNSNAFPGRLTSGAARTLWAQTYMTRKNWSQALALCNVVIASGQYSLLSNFVDIWKDGVGGAGKNSSESILEAQAYIGIGGTPDYGAAWATSQNVRQSGASNIWNLGWGWNTPTDKLENDWSNTDPRKAMTILYSGQYDGGAATGGYGATLPAYAPGSSLDQKYWNKKVYSDPAMRAATGHTTDGNAGWINHRILRYADVILMKAEAANEMGDGATAAAMLELIRARARNGQVGVLPYTAFTSQTQMRQAIKDERRWEFAMEGYRFDDLVRWGDAVSVLGSLGYTDRCKYYPIPQKAIDLSGGVLEQNPEWR